jgi:flagellar biosynthesis/type III secretory pathway M-ring protein FliF/YscJ
MKTNQIPAIVMLSAGLVACICGIRSGLQLADYLKMLLAVLLIFYVIGCVLKIVLDKLLAEKPAETEENKQGEQGEQKSEEDLETAEKNDTKEAEEDTEKKQNEQ